jgi:hypothetical protein
VKPLAIDLYCGLGGWAEGLLAEGYAVIGFDIERHDYGTGGYPGQLVIQDVTTLHGSQFKDATVIVASPPCQAYSYRAMPWKRAKALPPPDNTLFETCWRIRQEACEATGRYIPLIVENVRGAQKWVGHARWHFGSYFLWGDVPALMPITLKAEKFNPDATAHPPGSWFAIADSKNRGARSEAPRMCACICPQGCDCEAPEREGVALVSEHCPIHNYQRRPVEDCPVHDPSSTSGRKITGYSDPRRNGGRGVHLTSQREQIEGRKEGFQRDASAGVKILAPGHDTKPGSGKDWFDGGAARHGSKSNSRKAASAQIAKIPFPLAQHIARCFKPEAVQ